MDLKSLLEFYWKHTEEVILPFWIRALDVQHGGIYTCFNNTGDRLVSRDKYTWSQGRFLWLWSKTASMIEENRLPGDPESYYEHLYKTADFLEEHVFLENGNCAFVLTRTGEKKEEKPGQGFDTSIFADCFMAIGLARFAGLSQDQKRFNRTLGLYSSIRKRLATGSFRSEPYPVPEGYRAHSIPMIMLNVAQEMAYAAQELEHPVEGQLQDHCLSYMNEIMDDFCRKDYTVAEMLPGDPAGKDTLLSRHINPGHTLESMWFVMHTALKTGLHDTLHKVSRIIEKNVHLGWDVDFGGLLRFVDREGGRPRGRRSTSSRYEELIQDSWDMKLWWPHSEALYATLLAYTCTGDEKMRTLHDKIWHYVFKTFPNPDKSIGEWIQIRDRKGDPLDKIAALPVKDPFHILRNLLLLIELLEEEG